MSTSGWKTVIGGVLAQLCLGTIYLFGNTTTYFTSYLRQFDNTITYDDTLLIYATAIGCQGFTMMIGGAMEQTFGAKITTACGGALVALGTFFAAFTTTLYGYLFTQGLMLGVGMGISLSAPIVCAIKWMPDQKNLVSGIIVAGNGCGAFFFGIIATYVANPSSQQTGTDGYFSAESGVPDNTPRMFITLGICYGVLILLAYHLIEDPVFVSIGTDDDGALDGFDYSCHGSIQSSKLSVSPSSTLSFFGYSDEEDEIEEPEIRREPRETSRLDAPLPLVPLKPIMKATEYRPFTFSLERSAMQGEALPLDESPSPLGSPACSDEGIDIEEEQASLNSRSTNRTETSRVRKLGREREGERNKVDDIFPSQLLQHPLAWHLASCFVMTAVGGMYFAGTFKTYGEVFITDQNFLSNIGSASNIFNGLGRIFWGLVADQMGSVNTMVLLALFFSMILFTYDSSFFYGGDASFALWTFLIFFFEGGNFTLYLPITMDLFGRRYAGCNYGIVFIAFSVCNVFNIVYLAGLDTPFQAASQFLAVVTFAGFVNLVCLALHIKAIEESRPVESTYVLAALVKSPSVVHLPLQIY